MAQQPRNDSQSNWQDHSQDGGGHSQDGDSQGNPAQRMFGSQASFYAASQVHISDNRLTALQRMMAECPPPEWAVDLGAGAGFTAFAAAGIRPAGAGLRHNPADAPGDAPHRAGAAVG